MTEDFDLTIEVDDNTSATDLIEIIYNRLYLLMVKVGQHPDEIFLSPALYKIIKEHCRNKQKREMESGEYITIQGPQSNPVVIREQIL